MDSPTLVAFGLMLVWILLGPGTFVIVPYMVFFTNYYYIPILYYAWVLYDLSTGGCIERRSDWVRNLNFWKYLVSYFPIKLIATDTLDPNKNYIIGLHPHGVLASGAFSFGTEATGFSGKFPGIKPYLLGHLYLSLLPFREILHSLGFCPVSASNFNYILGNTDNGANNNSGGKAVVMVPGGVREMMASNPGKIIDLVIKNRKGFVRLALKNGASLVPVFTFGENRLYNHKEFDVDSLFHKMQQWLKRYTGFPIVSASGRFYVFPFRKPMTTVVGSPIHCNKVENPTQEEIDALHEKYLTSLINLFNTYKGSCGSQDDELNFLD